MTHPADTDIKFVALDSDTVSGWRSGGADANGQLPETKLSDGGAIPCRHCLDMVAKDDPYLVLAHRPFPGPQPYAEIGPIFVHAESCPRGETAAIPAFLQSPQYIVRGYGADDRIVYGTGAVVETAKIPERAAELFQRDDIAYLHVRSASNNCYHCRIDRA